MANLKDLSNVMTYVRVVIQLYCLSAIQEISQDGWTDEFRFPLHCAFSNVAPAKENFSHCKVYLHSHKGCWLTTLWYVLTPLPFKWQRAYSITAVPAYILPSCPSRMEVSVHYLLKKFLYWIQILYTCILS